MKRIPAPVPAYPVGYVPVVLLIAGNKNVALARYPCAATIARRNMLENRPDHTDLRKVAVVTDSVACIPPELARAYALGIIPVRITVDGTTYLDSDSDLTPETVERLRASSRIDTTPWPPEHYAAVYEQLGRTYSSVVHIVAFSRFTSTMSLAMEGAVSARSWSPGLRVEVVDSGSMGMAQGFAALAAARASAEGASLEHCCQTARDVAECTTSVFMLENLDYLARTGRVNRLAAWARSVLRVTPMVVLAHGRARPLSLSRSRARALHGMSEFVRSASSDCGAVSVAVMESEPSEEGDALEHTLHAQAAVSEVHRAPFTPVMRIVGGPGVLGVAVYCDKTDTRG